MDKVSLFQQIVTDFNFSSNSQKKEGGEEEDLKQKKTKEGSKATAKCLFYKT